jgi:hypothetical protein
LLIGSDHLMCPPLMRDFMRRHVRNIIDVFRFRDPRDESDAFRKRNRVREGLREAFISREFNDPYLFLLLNVFVPKRIRVGRLFFFRK